MGQSFTDRLLLALVPLLYSLVLRFLALTIRKETHSAELPARFWDRGGHVIIAFWHQRLLMMPFLPHRGKVGMLISRHRDGEWIARAVKFFGIDSVRGSTTRGGLSALRGMVRFFSQGGNLAITPDGPQGPRHVVQIGAIELARQTGAPILPVTYAASRKKVFSSWDGFIFPYPFSKVIYLWGEPIQVPRETGKNGLEEKRLLLEESLKKITEEADRLFECGEAAVKNQR
jgi:lysophospholipid acyltransferase (LPLAT)-like uncharacterized protein